MISDHNNQRFNRGKWPIGAFRMLISLPFIYGMLIPVVLLDLAVSLYKVICFPLYGIPSVKRGEYINFNRGKMESLNWADKLNCYYCSYVNGVLAYARKIAGETERMWCPIRNKILKKFFEPEHHKNFAATGKKEDLEKYYEKYEKDVKSKPEN